MRLTNQMRDDFANRVMKNIPWVATMTYDKMKEACVKRVEAQLPTDIQKMFKKYPHIFQQRRCYLKEIGDAFYALHIDDKIMEKVDFSDIIADYRQWQEEHRKRCAIHKKVRESTLGCTTTAALARVFPELVSLIPNEPAKKQLPVAMNGLVQELFQAGLKIEKGEKK